MTTSRKLIAILTPTYNRSNTLFALYNSLTNQTANNFKWYVIDDGSNDDTEQQVNRFRNDRFDVCYVKKDNGGKHTALNVGIGIIEEELVFIVDSDDYLTNDATKTIEDTWNDFKCFGGLCGMSFFKIHKNGDLVGSHFSCNEPFVSSFITERINNKVDGDKAEVWLSSVLKKHPFPIYRNEKFLSEAIVWNKLSAEGYKMVFVSKPIYICEYLDGGLTKSGRKLRLKCPYGTIDHALSYLVPETNMLTKLKYILYLDSVALYSKNVKYVWKRMGKYKCLYLVFLIFGAPLALHWKLKYNG